MKTLAGSLGEGHRDEAQRECHREQHTSPSFLDKIFLFSISSMRLLDRGCTRLGAHSDHSGIAAKAGEVDPNGGTPKARG